MGNCVLHQYNIGSILFYRVDRTVFYATIIDIIIEVSYDCYKHSQVPKTYLIVEDYNKLQHKIYLNTLIDENGKQFYFTQYECEDSMLPF